MRAWYVRRNVTREKAKDTLGDAKSEKTKKQAKYILISGNRGDKDITVYRRLYVTLDVSLS